MNEYEVLGVEEGASVEEIRRAYARAVAETHPDGGGPGGSKKEFERVREAYEILMERYAFSSEEGETGSRKETDDEVEKDLKFGWKMYKTPDMEFYVGHEKEEAYIDAEGKLRKETFYFNRSIEASTGFSRFLKHRKERLKNERESDEKEEGDEGGGRNWGSSQIKGRVDGFWHLTYQESEPWGENRRWAVYCRDKHVYVTPEGGVSEDEHWFDTEKEAIEAFEKHLEQAEDAGAIRLPLTLLYYVFVLPVKFVEFVLTFPLRLLGERDRQVPYVAEGVFFLILIGVGFLVNWRVGVVAVAQLGTALVYWWSPYEAHGPVVRPRWMRRNREVSTYDPDLSEE
jgi:curved DNA-binding protein CbpA